MRPAQPADSSAIAQLVIDAEMFPEDARGFIENMLGSYFLSGQANGHACLIDEQDGEVVGVAYYQPKPATDRLWDLTMIAVHPSRQGRGRGAVILRAVEDDLASRDQRLLLIETSASAQFHPARRFYVRNGYDEEARVRDYWEDGDDLILFRKALTVQ